jgi:hypothetical protein
MRSAQNALIASKAERIIIIKPRARERRFPFKATQPNEHNLYYYHRYFAICGDFLDISLNEQVECAMPERSALVCLKETESRFFIAIIISGGDSCSIAVASVPTRVALR